MKFVFSLIFLSFIAPLPVALAGGWSSGGGGFIKDARNPWFINNITEVKYCVRLDAENFGTDLTNVNRQIRQALQFWRAEFSHAVLPTLAKFGQVQIANQKFIEVSCGSDADLIFQFGVLTKQQRKQFREPMDYGAIAIRTDYDSKTLRGKGFIYVSPLKGPLAIATNGVPQDIWERKSGRALFLTLVHELGHVFGLPHGGSFGDLMSEGFVENLLASSSKSEESDFRYFSFATQSKAICPNDLVLKLWTNFFEADDGAKCFQFIFEHEPKSQLFGATVLRVLSSNSADGRYTEIGSGSLNMTRFNPVLVNILWLPTDQNVFAPSELLQAGFPSVLGPSLLKVSKQGRMRLAKGGTRTLSLELEQGRQGFLLTGVDASGELIHLF